VENDAVAMATAVNMDLKLFMMVAPCCMFASGETEMAKAAVARNLAYANDRDFCAK
jgi:hypothetical protein